MIEALLAVALFAIVMSACYGIFSMGIQIWRRTTTESQSERQAFLAIERLGKDLRAMVPNTLKDYKGSGTNREVIIPSLVRTSDSQGTARLQYGLIDYKWNSGARELCVKKISASDVYRNKSVDCRVIAGDIRAFKLRYLIYDGIGESFGWLDGWDAKKGLPAAVRLSLTVAPPPKKGRSPYERKIEKTIMVPLGRR